MSVNNKNLSEKQTFQFTRHAQSCNNISNIIDNDYEPSITYSGIMDSIEFAKKNAQIGAFTHNSICVSNLLRTWITAVLLYGSQISKMNNEEASKILTLYICPYLKEYTTKIPGMKTAKKAAHGTVNLGSYIGNKTLNIVNRGINRTAKKKIPTTRNNTKKIPTTRNSKKNIIRTVESIQNLSSQLNNIFQTGGAAITKPFHVAKKIGVDAIKTSINMVPHEIKHGNWPEKFAVSLNRFLKFLNNGPLYNKEWFNSLPQTIMFVLPGKGKNGWEEQQRQIIVITKQATNRYKITQFCKDCRALICKKNIDDTVGNKSKIPGYLQDGNLQEFMDWYQTSDLNISDTNNKVHVITHSNVMKGYLKKNFDSKKTIVKTTIKTIKATNVCRFVTSINQKTMPTIIRGVEINKAKAIELEEEAKDKKISLCGPDGTIIRARPICGKKTKKTELLHGLLKVKNTMILNSKKRVGKAARGTLKRVFTNPLSRKTLKKTR